jgi:hypothetical protein
MAIGERAPGALQNVRSAVAGNLRPVEDWNAPGEIARGTTDAVYSRCAARISLLTEKSQLTITRLLCPTARPEEITAALGVRLFGRRPTGQRGLVESCLELDLRSDPDRRSIVDRLSPISFRSSSDRLSTPERRSIPERLSFNCLRSSFTTVAPIKGIETTS